MQLNDRSMGNPNDAYSIDHATWPKNMNRPKSIRDGHDLIFALKLSGGDQNDRGQLVYVVPT